MLKLMGNIFQAMLIVLVLTGFRPQAMETLAVICFGVGVALAPFFVFVFLKQILGLHR